MHICPYNNFFINNTIGNFWIRSFYYQWRYRFAFQSWSKPANQLYKQAWECITIFIHQILNTSSFVIEIDFVYRNSVCHYLLQPCYHFSSRPKDYLISTIIFWSFCASLLPTCWIAIFFLLETFAIRIFFVNIRVSKSLQLTISVSAFVDFAFSMIDIFMILSLITT